MPSSATSTKELASMEWTDGLPLSGGWRYVFVLLTIGFTMVVSNHSFRFAAEAAGEKVDFDLTEDVGGTNALKQLGFMMLGLIGIGYLLMATPKSQNVSWPLCSLAMALGGYVLASSVWSGEWGMSLRRAMIPLLMLVSALGIARQWRPRDVCLCAAIIPGALLVIGVLAEVRYGTFLNLGSSDYRFSGTLHPNRQATNCGMLAISALCLFCEQRKVRWLLLFFVGSAFLLLARSRGATISGVVAVSIVSWIAASRVSKFVMASGLGIVCSIALLIFALSSVDLSQSVQTLSQMGRDAESADMSSLTGRIPIWFQATSDIAKSPWFGYGYGGFWTPQRVHYYSYILNWAFNNAHSIYFETLLNVGAIGLGLGLLIALLAVRRNLVRYDETREPGHQFGIGVMSFGAVHGLVEAIFVTPGLPLMFCLLSIGLAIFHGTNTPGVTHERS